MKNIYINLKKINKNYLGLFFLYSLSQVWIIFLGDSLFWDDWLYYTIGSENNLYNHMIMLGAPIRGFILNIFFPFDILLIRVITFFLFFTNSIFLDQILKRINIFNDNNRFLICALFLVFPANLARITFSIFPYTLGIFFFFFAWYIFPKNKFFSVLFFFISFSTNSLLVFYTLPIVEIFFNKYQLNKKSIFLFFKINFIFLILPFLYFSIKLIFFKPYGLFKNYNENFSFKSLFINPLFQINDALTLKSSLILFVPLIVLIFTYIFYKYIPIKSASNDAKYSKLIFVLGISSLFIGFFPYWILSYTPRFNDIWGSRHQLLMPLGISLLSSAILSRFEISSRRVFLSLLVTISVLINQTNYYALIKDQNKQMDLINQLSNFPLNENADFIIFEDETTKDNALNRKYRFYEWQGIFNTAYPDNKNTIAIGEESLGYLINIFKSNCQYFFGYEMENLPEEINLSKINVSYETYSLNNLSLPKKVYHILFNNGELKKRTLKETDFKTISKKNISENNLIRNFCKN